MEHRHVLVTSIKIPNEWLYKEIPLLCTRGHTRVREEPDWNGKKCAVDPGTTQVWTTQAHLDAELFQLILCNIANVFSLIFTFLLSSLLFCKNTVYNKYIKCVRWLFMLLGRLPVDKRLLCSGELKVILDFLGMDGYGGGWSVPLTPMLFKVI